MTHDSDTFNQESQAPGFTKTPNLPGEAVKLRLIMSGLRFDNHFIQNIWISFDKVILREGN